MSPTAPPLVQDPVPCDVDDAVFKEAKRRARRRRWSYGRDATCGVEVVDTTAVCPSGRCVIISTADARTVDQSFQDAGFQRSDREPPDAINIIKDTQVLHYVFDVPSGAGQTPTVEADVMFQPVFATCSRCG